MKYLLAFLLLATPAVAGSQCGKHDDIAKVLSKTFKENRRVLGVINNRTVMELFLSSEGTWTMLVTDTTGTACVTASGTDWQDAPVQVAGTDS